MKDPNLRRCSHGARGVWIDMLCLMFECEQRGVLITGSSPWSYDDVAAAVGGNMDFTLRCIDELVSKGVCKVREDSALYSVRMVKDEEERKKSRERVQKHRCNVSVTPMSHRSSSSISSSISKKEEAMSGSPPDDVPPKRNLNQEAREVLAFLNAKTGRNYEDVDANMNLIRARLKDASVQDCKSIIAKKCRDWRGNEKMEPYLRPATLFNATKFAQYQGELLRIPDERGGLP